MNRLGYFNVFVSVICVAIFEKSWSLTQNESGFRKHAKNRWIRMAKDLKFDRTPQKLTTIILNETKPDTFSFTTKEPDARVVENLQKKHAALYAVIVEALTENDEMKKKFVRRPAKSSKALYANPIESCFLEAYGTFLTSCCSINHYENLHQFKILFHRVCSSEWMEKAEMWERIQEVCDANKHLRL